MLTRIDPTRNMDRWYSVSVQATLLDPIVVCLAWGSRHTSYVRMRTIPVSSLDKAQALAERIVRQKIRRGYTAVG